MNADHAPDDELDLATARRLRRLSTMPVDLSGLEARIAEAIPRTVSRTGSTRALRFRPMWAVAASFVVLVSLSAALVLSTARPVVASTEMLSDLYSHNTTLMEARDDVATMPCCVRQVEGRNVTCVAIDVSGKRVMMAIGDGRHFKVPDTAGRRTVNGTEYRYQSDGKVNMVMALRDGAWICLMGEPSIDSLLARLATMPGHGQ